MARYVIVRYFPIADNGECVNAGVIAYDDNIAMARFVSDWGRVQRFGQRDVTFLREFAREVANRTSSDADASSRLTRERIEAMASRWGHAIQFSAPGGSVLGVPELLKEMAAHFLPTPRVPASKPRDRRAARVVAWKALGGAFQARGLHKLSEYIKNRHPILGNVKEHEFDFVIANGRVRDGVFAFSFEGGVNSRVVTEIEAAAFAIDDVRHRLADVHISALVLEPEVQTPELDMVNRIIMSKGASLVRESEADAWAEDVSSRYAHAI